MNIKNYLFSISRRSGALLLFLISVITTGFLIWTSNKGLDITDEGIYLMATQFPVDVKIATSAFYIYTAILYAIAGHNVVVLRIIGILIMIGSAIFLFWGLYYTLKTFGIKFLSDLSVLITAWSLVSLGALLHYAWWLLTPGYNLINAAILNIAGGFLFFGLAFLESKARIYLSYAAFCGVGLCVGISFLVKFSSGLSLFVLIFCILLFWPHTSFLNKIKNIISVGIGVIVWLSIHFGFIQTPASWWQNFHRGVENALLISPAYGAASINRYFFECIDLLKVEVLNFWKFYFALLISSGLLLLFRRRSRDWRYLPQILLLTLLIAAGGKSFWLYFSSGIRNVYTGNLMIVYMFWIVILLFAIIVTLTYQQESLKRRQYNKRYHLLLTGVALFAFPFAGVVGTGNPIYTSIFLYLTPWFAILIILLMALSILYDTKWIFGCGAFIIGMLACSQIVCGVLMVPYRLNTPMLGQTVPTDIGMPSTRLMLDQATSNFFKTIHGAARANGFKPGDDVLAFCDMAGVVFSMGGRSPYITHYTSGYQGSLAANEISLSMIPRERIRKAFILQNVSGASWKNRVSGGTNGFPDLTKFGIDFPGDYILCGEAISPYYKDLVRLWKPK